jgi:hypothetical protein
LEKREKKLIPWAWATNAFFSVCASILALQIAFWAGYTVVMLCGGGAYLLALVFLDFADHGNKANA